MNEINELCQSYNETVRALEQSLRRTAALARGLSDSELTLAPEKRPAARSQYLTRLYESAHVGDTGELTHICDRIIALRSTLPPTSPDVRSLDSLAALCRDMLELANTFQGRLLPQHMSAVGDSLESSARLERGITAGFVSSLDILLGNVQGAYCSLPKNVL